MVKTNIESVVPLLGRGHTVRRAGGYLDGEYPRLINAEINESGHIVNRRNFRAVADVQTDSMKFIGNMNANIILLGENALKAVYLEDTLDLFNPTTAFPAPVSALSYNTVKKFIHYNNKAYWVRTVYDTGTLETRIEISYKDAEILSDLVSGTGFTTVVVATKITTEDDSNPEDPVNTYFIKDAFMHKDRMWIITQDTLFFSKATDPSVWTAPDGGFFKISGSNVNAVIPLRDSLYVICSNAIHVITYSTDPNVDPTQKILSPTSGGENGCVFEDTVYFVKGDSLFAISNANVSKVMDLGLGTEDPEGRIFTKLESFGEHIVIQKYVNESYADVSYDSARGESKHHPIAAYNAKYPTSAWDDHNYAHSTYMLHMRTGTIHALTLWAGVDNGAEHPTIQLCDFYFAPYDAYQSSVYMYFLGKKFTGNVSSIPQYKGYCYAMPLEYASIDQIVGVGTTSSVHDEVHNHLDAVVRRLHPIDIEIYSFMPDGSEYNMKKFRHLLLQGKFPELDFKIAFNFDRITWNDYMSLISAQDSSEERFPGTYRKPINQRARSLGIRMKQDQNTSPDGEEYTLSCEDIRIYWSPTTRSPVRSV